MRYAHSTTNRRHLGVGGFVAAESTYSLSPQPSQAQPSPPEPSPAQPSPPRLTGAPERRIAARLIPRLGRRAAALGAGGLLLTKTRPTGTATRKRL